MSKKTPSIDIDDLVLEIDDSDPWMPRVYLFNSDTNERLFYIETDKVLHKGDTFKLQGEITFS